jgi:hypothetical protein
MAAAAVEAPVKVSEELVNKCVNAIRFLAIDAVNKAKSGHPGLPMGAAPMSYVLFNEAMTYNPKNPQWFNRDRFVLSAGHGSMLQYALLHLVGYDSVQVSSPRAWGMQGGVSCAYVPSSTCMLGFCCGLAGYSSETPTALLNREHISTLSALVPACSWTTSSSSANGAPPPPATPRTS